jgi:predicted RNA-binding Zn-ribbon protein involved in translation (DUF1610 family)
VTAEFAPVTRPAPTRARAQLEEAHTRAVRAAVSGMSDAALGPLRLAGTGVPRLADAAVTSATPYLRAPILSRVSAALRLHPPGGDVDDSCPTCGTVVPCETARALAW